MLRLKEKNRQYIGLQVDQPEKARELLIDNMHIQDCRLEEAGWLRVYDVGEHAGEMNRFLNREGILVHSLSSIKDSLEDYFVNLIEGGKVIV